MADEKNMLILLFWWNLLNDRKSIVSYDDLQENSQHAKYYGENDQILNKLNNQV